MKNFIQTSPALNVGIFLFDEVELLDFAGPQEVFTTANRLCERQQLQAPFNVITFSDQQLSVRSRAGLVVQADCTRANLPEVQLLILPGGVVDGPRDNPELLAWLKNRRASTAIMASICNGAFLLADADLLQGLSATTHWEDAPLLAEQFPALSVQPEHRFIDHQHTLTTAGVSAGIDASLHLIARLANPALAIRTARQMDYPWQPNQ